ncbi:MAG: DUF4349 domain-containing protein [Acidimicrobiia bacterium]|nr:DUF4349 domain-containing protein [Acidimicrobiia bacterium]
MQPTEQGDTTTPQRRSGRWRILAAAAGAFVLLSAVAGWAAVGRMGGGKDVVGDARFGADAVPTTVAPQSDMAGAGETGSGTVGTEAAPQADMAPVPTEPLQIVVQGDKQVRSGSLTMTIEDDLDAALDQARGAVSDVGGFVADLQRSSSEEGATATVTLRVPADQFDVVMGRLEGLGEVTSSTQATEDVTQQSIDIDARLRSLGAEAEALRGLLARAATTAEILEIRRQLNDITTQIEVLQAQGQALDQQIAMSTISLNLATPGAVVGPEPTPFWEEALGEAWDRLENGLAAIFVGAATLIPFALLGLALFFVGRLLWRRWQPPAGDGDIGHAAGT